jgi:hypothetical protein
MIQAIIAVTAAIVSATCLGLTLWLRRCRHTVDFGPTIEIAAPREWEVAFSGRDGIWSAGHYAAPQTKNEMG